MVVVPLDTAAPGIPPNGTSHLPAHQDMLVQVWIRIPPADLIEPDEVRPGIQSNKPPLETDRQNRPLVTANCEGGGATTVASISPDPVFETAVEGCVISSALLAKRKPSFT